MATVRGKKKPAARRWKRATRTKLTILVASDLADSVQGLCEQTGLTKNAVAIIGLAMAVGALRNLECPAAKEQVVTWVTEQVGRVVAA